MRKKLISIGIVCLFLLTAVVVNPVNGADISKAADLKSNSISISDNPDDTNQIEFVDNLKNMMHQLAIYKNLDIDHINKLYGFDKDLESYFFPQVRETVSKEEIFGADFDLVFDTFLRLSNNRAPHDDIKSQAGYLYEVVEDAYTNKFINFPDEDDNLFKSSIIESKLDEIFSNGYSFEKINNELNWKGYTDPETGKFYPTVEGILVDIIEWIDNGRVTGFSYYDDDKEEEDKEDLRVSCLEPLLKTYCRILNGYYDYNPVDGVPAFGFINSTNIKRYDTGNNVDIEDIRIEDSVLGMVYDYSDFCKNTVRNKYGKEVKNYYKITTESGKSVGVSEGIEFNTKSGGSKPSEKLLVGDEVKVLDESTGLLTTEKITSIDILGKKYVTNIEVDGWCNYFANGFLVNARNFGDDDNDPDILTYIELIIDAFFAVCWLVLAFFPTTSIFFLTIDILICVAVCGILTAGLYETRIFDGIGELIRMLLPADVPGEAGFWANFTACMFCVFISAGLSGFVWSIRVIAAPATGVGALIGSWVITNYLMGRLRKVLSNWKSRSNSQTPTSFNSIIEMFRQILGRRTSKFLTLKKLLNFDLPILSR